MVEHQYLYIFGITIFIGMIFSLPIFKYLDDEVHEKRNTGMDGLRYFLASFVAIFHSDYFVRYITTGKWETIYNDVSYIAQFSVSIFFMITAFLFWGKVSTKDNIDWVNLYKDRFFRIAPATIFTAMLSIVVILYLTNYPNPSNYLHAKDVFRWMDMGLFYNYPPMNYFKDSWVFLGVFWTLQWEWGFYFSLPLLYLFRKNGTAFVLALMFIFIYLIGFIPALNNIKIGVCILFVAGMLCYDLLGKIRINKITCEVILLVSIVGIFIYQPELYSTTMLPWYFCMLFAICKGANLFGVLSFKGFVRLGNVSFSIYVLHSVILYTIFTWMHTSNIIKEPADFKLVYLLCAFGMVCVISSLCYALIERPFINLGRKIKL
ncbi:TPA: acyltransferase family protein [Enterobacter asburiae]